MKIIKAEFDSLYSDDITKKEYDKIIGKIDNRFGEIMLTLKPALRKDGWFDYNNCSYDSEDSNGYFNPKCNKEEIEIGGENSELPEPFSYYIPTRWLWEDFQEDFNNQVKKHLTAVDKKKCKAKENAKNRKEVKEKLRKSIEKKLTKEELKIIKF